MEDLNDKIPGNTLTASEWNQPMSELQNLFEAFSIVASGADLNQVGKAITNLVATADFYADGGAADAYVLSSNATNQNPTGYFTGMRIRFAPGNANTGASTVNVATLGIKTLSYRVLDGNSTAALPSGYLVFNRPVEAIYDGAQFVIEPVPMSSSVSSSSTTVAANSAAVNGVNVLLGNLQTAVGNTNSTNMGPYTGGLLTDNLPAKSNIQQLADNVENAQTALGNSNSTNMGTYTGGIITDNQPAKTNIQDLETAAEANKIYYLNDGDSSTLPSGQYTFTSAGRLLSSNGGATITLEPTITGNANFSGFCSVISAVPESTTGGNNEGGGNAVVSTLTFELLDGNGGVISNAGGVISYQATGRIGLSLATNMTFNSNFTVSAGTETIEAFLIATKVA